MRQNLIFDADDTLWENNIYFEAAFEQFCDFLAHSAMTPRDIRSVLDEIEIANAKIHGYGSRNFGRNLAACFEHLAEREISGDDLETVMGFAHRILEKPIQLIDGVAETLADLSARHELTIFTKGDPEEQRLLRRLCDAAAAAYRTAELQSELFQARARLALLEAGTTA